MATQEANKIETRWQEIWSKAGIYSPNLVSAKKPFYNLMMFPYPSAEGLHVGNMYAFCGSDIYGRFKRMQGFDVFEPIGLDGFGIHSENYAIKVNRNPTEQAKVSQKNFYRQLRSIGNAYDWSRTLETYDPDYYKWTQWIFSKLFEAGLAYRKKSPVNFCPTDKTVLADEQVIDGKCERCGTEVVKKELEQWFFRITKYADRLLEGLNKIDWSERVKIAQRNWIGKKEGINIEYKIAGKEEKIICWTSRPDTNFGATFIVLAPEHQMALKITDDGHGEDVERYIRISKNKLAQERLSDSREKTGVFTGAYAINNLNGEKLPIWVSDFVLMEFGTGAVVGVPGHDRRDFEFAKKFGLPIKRVVVGSDDDRSSITKIEQVQEREGKMINSQFLNGLDIHKATVKVMDYLEQNGWGKRETTYHLRDWLISRQRYWGPPIPIIYCRNCWENSKPATGGSKQKKLADFAVIDGREYAIIAVPEKDLPVILPDVADWRPKGDGKSPLANILEFVNTKCPNCGGKAQRETDVSDTFLDSAWYFLRYISTDKKSVAWDDQRVSHWLPVDMYIGGAEHSVLHLLYTRFLTMVFKDLGLVSFEEPFSKFRAHGLLISKGAKMSKSRGNIVNPDDYISKYGADTLRCYLMFCGRFEQGGDFIDTGIEGISRFLKRVWRLVVSWSENSENSESQRIRISDTPKHRHTESSESSEDPLRIMHKTIKKVTADIENLSYNTAIAAMMEWLNALETRAAGPVTTFPPASARHKSASKGGQTPSLRLRAVGSPSSRATRRINITHHSSLITKEEVEALLLLLAPFAPHMTEELWSRLSGDQVIGRSGKKNPENPTARQPDNRWSIHQQPWPKYDEKLAKATTIELVIEVDGKVRDRVSVAAGVSEDEAKRLALASEKIKKYVEGKNFKVIYVVDKLINLVTGR